MFDTGKPRGKYYVVESGFLSGSGATIAEIKVESGLGYPATRGYFINESPSIVTCYIAWSSGKVTNTSPLSGDNFTMRSGEKLTFDNNSVISSFYVSYSGVPSGTYRSFWQ